MCQGDGGRGTDAADIVLPVIYEESSSMWQTAESGWVTTTLLGAGVGLRDVWETVAGLYERVSNITYPNSEIWHGDC
jgi:hypothetical protein